DPILGKLETKVKLEFEETFMFYLPRICEHCLNPSCAASCPSGAIYKREEDGIVLVDQDKCRGWRQCITGCPYKKIYFNHKTGKAEKCTFCYPRVEVGIPTVCSETCVGRLRYIGVMLYDADAVLEAAQVTDPQDLYTSQLGVFLNPHDERVIAEAEKAGISPEWIQAAQDSPVYKLIVDYQLALPLHPEYRTMPMVWYVPPLSPVVDVLAETGHDGEDVRNLFGAIDALRIPLEYLAELFTAGEIGPVRSSLQRLAGMRAFMRSVNLGEEPEAHIAPSIGLEPEEIEAMYRLLAIAKYEHRYVIPMGATSKAHELDSLATGCSLDTDGGPGMTAFDQVVEKFSLSDVNQAAPEEKSGRINLLNWDGRSTSGLLPGANGKEKTGNGAGNGNGSNGAAVADSPVSGVAP
ncbi:4Fe-4S dicluster domain-containing protein, partial [Nocardia salmonicida]